MSGTSLCYSVCVYISLHCKLDGANPASRNLATEHVMASLLDTRSDQHFPSGSTLYLKCSAHRKGCPSTKTGIQRSWSSKLSQFPVPVPCNLAQGCSEVHELHTRETLKHHVLHDVCGTISTSCIRTAHSFHHTIDHSARHSTPCMNLHRTSPRTPRSACQSSGCTTC